ncbi:hypothetical protein B0H11DRAFT_1907422 [Mycena galericulata]|nr:hypothetical protein B0H11DRAFT_1907422 [Mycena galericulata]
MVNFAGDAVKNSAKAKAVALGTIKKCCWNNVAWVNHTDNLMSQAGIPGSARACRPRDKIVPADLTGKLMTDDKDRHARWIALTKAIPFMLPNVPSAASDAKTRRTPAIIARSHARRTGTERSHHLPRPKYPARTTTSRGKARRSTAGTTPTATAGRENHMADAAAMEAAEVEADGLQKAKSGKLGTWLTIPSSSCLRPNGCESLRENCLHLQRSSRSSKPGMEHPQVATKNQNTTSFILPADSRRNGLRLTSFGGSSSAPGHASDDGAGEFGGGPVANDQCEHREKHLTTGGTLSNDQRSTTDGANLLHQIYIPKDVIAQSVLNSQSASEPPDWSAAESYKAPSNPTPSACNQPSAGDLQSANQNLPPERRRLNSPSASAPPEHYEAPSNFTPSACNQPLLMMSCLQIEFYRPSNVD